MSRIPLYNLVFFHSALQRAKLRISGAKHLIESYLFLTTLFFTLLTAFRLSSGLSPLSSDSYHIVFSWLFTVTSPFPIQSHLCPSTPASSPPGQLSLYPPWIPPTASNISCSEQPQAIQLVHNILNAVTSPFCASKPRLDIPAWHPNFSANEGSNFKNCYCFKQQPSLSSIKMPDGGWVRESMFMSFEESQRGLAIMQYKLDWHIIFHRKR